MKKIPAQVIELSGKTFSRWSVIEFHSTNNHGDSKWTCRCQCGVVKNVMARHLKSGESGSCGCLAIENTRARKTTHGKESTVEYWAWASAKVRCTNPNCEAFRNYGARGIQICERWKHSFENFFADMGPRPEGMTLERKDNHGDYEPGNCIWATINEQANNRRSNVKITRNGVTLTMAQWAKRLGINYATFKARVRLHWPVPKLFIKVKPRRHSSE